MWRKNKRNLGERWSNAGRFAYTRSLTNTWSNAGGDRFGPC